MASKTVTAAVKVSIEGKEYKAAMREINRENKEFKKQQKEAMKQAKLSAEEGFGGVIALAKKMAPAISAGAAALKVAQTAMLENQRYTDEWGRITESARASYENFVNTLVSGDFSGYLSNMKAVIQTAREAYDALDAVGTANIFYNKSMAESELAIRQARYTIKSPAATAEERRAAGEVLQREQNKQIAEAKQMADVYMEAFASKLASEVTRGGYKSSASDFVERNADGRVITRSGSLFDKYYKDLETYNRMNAIYQEERRLRNTIVSTSYSPQGLAINTYAKGRYSDAEFKEMEAFLERPDESLRESFDLLQKAWQTENAVLTKSIENFEYLRNANKPVTSGVGGGVSSASSFAAGSIAEINQRLTAAREEMNLATDDAAREVARKLVMALEEELSRAQTFRRASGIESIGNLPGLQGVGLKPLTLDPSVIRGKSGEADANKDLAKSGETAAEGIMLVSDTLQQLGIMSNVADEGLRTTMRVVGQFLSMIGGFIGGPVGKGISAIGSLVGSFSGGGIVGGTSYTGDRLTARVNSGEMILNATQQRSLFQMLNGGGSTGGGSSVVRGEDIYLALRNYGRRTGKIHLP
jgi:hypothetical protein